MPFWNRSPRFNNANPRTLAESILRNNKTELDTGTYPVQVNGRQIDIHYNVNTIELWYAGQPFFIKDSDFTTQADLENALATWFQR